MPLAVGDKDGRTTASVRLYPGRLGDVERVSCSLKAYAHCLRANCEQIGCLGDVVVAAIDVQAYAKGRCTGTSFNPLPVLPLIVGVDIDVVFQIVVVDGVPEKGLSVQIESQVLQDCQFSLHEGGPVAPILMAHEAVLQLDMRKIDIIHRVSVFIVIACSVRADYRNPRNTVRILAVPVLGKGELCSVQGLLHVRACEIGAGKVVCTCQHEFVLVFYPIKDNFHAGPRGIAVHVAQAFRPARKTGRAELEGNVA